MKSIGTKRVIATLITLLMFAILFTGCAASEVFDDEQSQDSDTPSRMGINVESDVSIDDVALADREEMYTQDGYGANDMIYFYVTVSRGAAGSVTDHSFAEVQAFEKQMDDYTSTPIYAEATIQEGDKNGPYPSAFGYGAALPNATINVRGSSTTRVKSEKSFSFKLKDAAGRWRGQSNISLIKSSFDPSRVYNKLSFDLFKDIPDIVSCRTQFVRLFIQDATADSDEFIDYGFYTQVEVPNKRFLKNHALDDNGHLYKAIMFEFYRYEDVLRTKEDPEYSEEKFNAVLEIKGNEDHTKVINMLRDVNDYSLDINTVMQRHFNLDNYLTWLAINILTGNNDTTSQNFLLYSPQNGNKWYFILWDYDGAWGTWYDIKRDTLKERLGKYAVGMSNYWSVVLHQRFLKVPENRAMLEAKMDELEAIYLTPEKISAQMQAYLPLVTEQYQLMPDFYHLNFSLEDHLQSFEETPLEIERNKKLYYETLKWPMPFYLWEPVRVEDGLWELSWQPSYSLQGEDIYYDVVISQYPDKSHPAFSQRDLREAQVQFEALESGLYYYWVEARLESGEIMPAFDSLTVDGTTIWGVRQFLVTQNGEIVYDYDFYKNQ